MAKPSTPSRTTTNAASRKEFRLFAEIWSENDDRLATVISAAILSAEAEVDVRDVRRLRFGVEEVALDEAEDAGDQDRRKGLDPGVVVEHRHVVVLARERDLVLGRGQLLLELEHVL